MEYLYVLAELFVNGVNYTLPAPPLRKAKKKKSYTVIVLPNNTCYVSRQKYVFNFSSPGPQFFQTFIQRDKFRWRTWQNSLNLFSTYHDAKITPTTGTVLKVGQ